MNKSEELKAQLIAHLSQNMEWDEAEKLVEQCVKECSLEFASKYLT